MNADFDYLEINRKSWNSRVDVHLKSDFYDVKGFLEGESSLNDIELGLLGDIRVNLFYIYNAISDKILFRWADLGQMLQVLIYRIKRLIMQKY